MRPERADSRPEKANGTFNKANFWPDRAKKAYWRSDLRPKRADFSPENFSVRRLIGGLEELI